MKPTTHIVAMMVQLAKENLERGKRRAGAGKRDQTDSMLSRVQSDVEIALALSRGDADMIAPGRAIKRARQIRQEKYLPDRRKRHMKNMILPIGILFSMFLIGCASSTPPAELVNARESFRRASAGTAAKLVPAELHKAQVSLAAAEASFQDDATSYQTRDLAYVADRKARMAEALATTASGNAATANANKNYKDTQTEVMKNTKEDLAASERAVDAERRARLDEERKNTAEVAASERAVAAEQTARLEAEKKAADAQEALSKLATLKEEARGLVITLSGSVFFASNQSALLPSAQNRLSQVAEALLATKERNLTIEGHTDSQGSSEYNQQLSLRRADAVRSFLISRGYPVELIVSSGIGEDRPVADNTNPEGRANNRRVEIVVNNATGIGSINK